MTADKFGTLNEALHQMKTDIGHLHASLSSLETRVSQTAVPYAQPMSASRSAGETGGAAGQGRLKRGSVLGFGNSTEVLEGHPIPAYRVIANQLKQVSQFLSRAEIMPLRLQVLSTDPKQLRSYLQATRSRKSTVLLPTV